MWQRDLQEEVDAAGRQGAPDILERGLVLLVRRSGRVVRRGVGVPPWKSLRADFGPSSAKSAIKS